MCDDPDDVTSDPCAQPAHAVHPGRRGLLVGTAAAIAAPLVLRGGPSRAAAAHPETGQRAVVAAMHVHGSFSEQQGSWQGQTWRASQESVDLLFMTDHSQSLLAVRMASDLERLVMVPRSTGDLTSDSLASRQAGAVRLVAESRSAAAASSAMVVDPDVVANRPLLRTSVSGHVLRHAFGGVDVDPDGRYEVRVGLSHHPATAGRPDGVYGLCYRFGPHLARGAALEDGGLTAVVTRPLPPGGTTVALALATDAARAWPDLVPEDNGIQWLSFGAVSAAAGCRVAVDVDCVTIERATRTPSSVAQIQQRIAQRCSEDYGLAVVPSAELGVGRHHNAFVASQYLPDDEVNAARDSIGYTTRTVAAVHAAGGMVSWNHPFGATVGTPLTGARARARRQAVFADLMGSDLFGADILEVGYGVRGSMSIEDHIGLWDTFSRHARFLTANGVTDSHDSAVDRRRSGNEFVTGIWSGTTSMTDVLPALGSGRAFTRHATFWAGGELDLVVDGSHLMGEVVIGPPGPHLLTISATRLPTGAVVEVVVGAVDHRGVDPLTWVAARLPATAFGAAGVATHRLSVSRAVFVRLTVRDQQGAVIGVGNPVWLLTAAPPGGVPSARSAR